MTSKKKAVKALLDAVPELVAEVMRMLEGQTEPTLEELQLADEKLQSRIDALKGQVSHRELTDLKRAQGRVSRRNAELVAAEKAKASKMPDRPLEVRTKKPSIKMPELELNVPAVVPRPAEQKEVA